jgi:hypothetical protein
MILDQILGRFEELEFQARKPDQNGSNLKCGME